MILLRKNLDYANTFTYGEFIPFHPDIHNLMAYYRSGDKDILIIANYQKTPARLCFLVNQNRFY